MKNEKIGITPMDWALSIAGILVLLCFIVLPPVFRVALKDKAWTRPWDGKNIADIDATIVMDHIILAATDVGLGTCYVGAFKADKAKRFLNLDENEVPVLFTPLGYGNAEPRDTPRMELDEFVEYI